MRGLLESFLEELAGVMEALGRTNPSPMLDPRIFSWSLVSLTVLAAFSHTLAGPLTVLGFTLILAIFLRVEARPLSSILAVSLVLGWTPALPLLFSEKGWVNEVGDLDLGIHEEGAVAAACLAARVAAAAAPLAVAVLHLGWPTLVKSLTLAGRDARPDPLLLVPVLIPRLARHLSELLGAREARLVKPRLGEEWRILASVIGDSLRGAETYSRSLALAVEARSMAPLKPPLRRLGIREALYLAAWLAVVVLWVVIETCSWS